MLRHLRCSLGQSIWQRATTRSLHTSPRIHKSPARPFPIVESSIFTFLLSKKTERPGYIGAHLSSHPAFIDSSSGVTLTRQRLRHLALSFGHGLKHQLGIQEKDTVLIYSPNSLAFPVALLGSIAAGLRCTLANSAYTSIELAQQYRDSKAHIVITAGAGLDTVRTMFKHLGLQESERGQRIVVMPESFSWVNGSGTSLDTHSAYTHMENLLDCGELNEETSFNNAKSNETALLCYSSGTEGHPKGVETTHRNITAVAASVQETFITKPETDVLLGLLPFYHIYGALHLLFWPLLAGIPVVIQPRFDPKNFCANVEKYRATVAYVVPPMLVVLARNSAISDYDVTSLKTLVSGAAPLGASLQEQVRERFAQKHGQHTLEILQGFGLTETSPTTHMEPRGTVHKTGSIGILLSNLEARIVINETEDAMEGEPGELWLRGPGVMKGYLNNPEATKLVMTEDGWLKTGDIATRDLEGFYYIVDRRKELIKYKGFQVPPAEIESVLLTHPCIADAAVIGVYNAEEVTEVPRAYVVHAEPSTVQSPEQQIAFQDEVERWIRSRVARHKYLRGGVEVIDVIPKSASGKILRRQLRDKASMEKPYAVPE